MSYYLGTLNKRRLVFPGPADGGLQIPDGGSLQERMLFGTSVFSGNTWLSNTGTLGYHPPVTRPVGLPRTKLPSSRIPSIAHVFAKTGIRRRLHTTGDPEQWVAEWKDQAKPHRTRTARHAETTDQSSRYGEPSGMSSAETPAVHQR